MTNKRSTENTDRRRLLKALGTGGGVLAAGGALPASWKKPLVESVILPAHAQGSAPFFGVLSLPSTSDLRQTPGVLDLLLGKAYADFDEGGGPSYIPYLCVTPNGDSAIIDLVLSNFGPAGTGVQFGGTVPIGGENSLSFVGAGVNCVIKEPTINLELDSLAIGTLNVGSLPIPFDLAVQPCNLPGLGICIITDDASDTL